MESVQDHIATQGTPERNGPITHGVVRDVCPPTSCLDEIVCLKFLRKNKVDGSLV